MEVSKNLAKSQVSFYKQNLTQYSSSSLSTQNNQPLKIKIYPSQIYNDPSNIYDNYTPT
jgi:hypothetical protein